MSRRALDETLHFVGNVERADTPDAVALALLAAVQVHGFSHVIAGVIPTPGTSAKEQIANVVLHQWPDVWSRRYFSKGYIFTDPAIRRVTSSMVPFSWTELWDHDSPAGHRILGEAAEFGLKEGFTVPMVTLDGHSAGLSIAGAMTELPPHLRGPVQMMAIYSFARAAHLRERPPAPVTLTIREADVLHWIAEGKTDWEIARILQVSEHLVDKVARQIKSKFQVVNRVQAVVQAMRAGVIH
ncbi:LuxR family transcriptional regulator [Rhodopseudomonas sp. AAP120]|uniref:helix-turn-helix transcriptional regulator n=1 Tax=Rhodopseudomonas TaxID=1073 RepID=UPI000164A8F7|nr:MULTISPECIES: LuxR family transcriptional regulator [Rhodopseudomonas]ACF00848.1 transcriptional regulator, LuxR family [Rhodopseudomonas palustris TIE-1]KPG01730.1 LuxR family transcriptional regulator [Rhodopseudomonas sp. AAP120]